MSLSPPPPQCVVTRRPVLTVLQDRIRDKSGQNAASGAEGANVSGKANTTTRHRRCCVTRMTAADVRHLPAASVSLPVHVLVNKSC